MHGSSTRWCTRDGVVSFAALAGLALFFFLHRVGNSDLFWQMKIGQLLSWGSSFVVVDPFSFTAYGEPWTNHEWLSGLCFYAAYAIDGYRALSCLSFGIGLCLAIVLWRGLAVQSRRPALALLLVFLIFMIAAPRLQQLRPELFGLLLCTVFLVMLADAPRYTLRHLWVLVPLQILWANLHASALVGPGIVVIFSIVAAIVGVAGRRLENEERRTLAILSVMCVLANGINPFGLFLYCFPFEHLSHDFAIAVTGDWRSPHWWSGGADVAPWGLLLLTVLCAIQCIRRPRPMHWPLAVLALGFLPAGFLMLRFAPMAAVVLVLFLASQLPRQEERAARVNGIRLAALLLCLGTPMLLGPIGPLLGARHEGGRVDLLLGRPMGVGFDSADFPVAAVDFIERRPTITRLFNDMAWGGYLIWRLWPQHAVYFDTRTPVYGEERYRQYVQALHDEVLFEAIVERCDIDAVLYDRRELGGAQPPLGFLLTSSRWMLIFSSDNALLFVRTKG